VIDAVTAYRDVVTVPAKLYSIKRPAEVPLSTRHSWTNRPPPPRRLLARCLAPFARLPPVVSRALFHRLLSPRTMTGNTSRFSGDGSPLPPTIGAKARALAAGRDSLAAPSKRPVGRRPRPRWQLKFHFNPEFPQYFSIPSGLVVPPDLRRLALGAEGARGERVPRCSLPGQRSGGEQGRRKRGRGGEEHCMKRTSGDTTRATSSAGTVRVCVVCM